MATGSGPAPGKDKDNKDAVDQSMIGAYKIVSFIAGGKNSQVWEVQAADGQKRIALKQLTGDAMKDSEQIAAMKNEFTIGKQLDHPNIIKYFDGHWGTMFKKEAYFTMELFNAPNLKAQVFNHLTSVQVRLKRIVESAAMAYQHLHDKGYINRDIKPDNVLVNKSGELKVIDMSLAGKPAGALAKVFAPKSKTAKGTRSYMAPEQIMRKPLSFQVDLYSFGVMLFEMLTGNPPFAGSTPNDLLMRHIQDPAPPPSMINSNVTEEMDRIVLRLLAKKPDQRHKSFNEFLAEFRRVNPWKEEVVEKRELTEKEKAEQEVGGSLGERLDSRTDAMRTMLGIAPPKKAAPAPSAAPAKKPQPAPASPTPPQPAARPAAPVAAAPMAAFPPGVYPGGFVPGQFPAGQMYPGQFPPGQFVPGQFAPGQFPPGFQPGMMPPVGYYPPQPQPPYPGMPQAPGQLLPNGMPAPWVGVPGQAPPSPVTPAGGGASPPVPPGGVRPPQVPVPPTAARPAVPAPPVAPKPATTGPAKAPVAPPPAKKPSPPPADSQMKIDDLLGFDDLASA
jgi:serine/threonine-protein kinase